MLVYQRVTHYNKIKTRRVQSPSVIQAPFLVGKKTPLPMAKW